MPKQEIAQANPPPDASLLPDGVLDLRVTLNTKDYLSSDELRGIQLFRRAADYLAAAMIFLKDNVLLEEQLDSKHIKPRLLGHWGTCPGLVLVQAHVNRLIRTQNLDALYVVGPGHGAPAVWACLWLEDSISPFYPKYTRDRAGLQHLIAGFSAPGGFPRYANDYH